MKMNLKFGKNTKLGINKKGYKPNYFLDVVVSGLILAFFMIFVLIFFRGGASSINSTITVGEMGVSNQENLLVFLREPMQVIDKITVFVVEKTDGEVRDFADGSDSVTFSGTKTISFNLKDTKYNSATFEIEGHANLKISYSDGSKETFKSPGTFDFTKKVRKLCTNACSFSMTINSDAKVTIKNIMILGPVVAPGEVTQEKKIMKPISQVIIDSYNKQSYTSIEPKMKEFVNSLEHGDFGYQLVIRSMPERTTTRIVNSDHFSPGNSLRIASIKLPLLDPHKWVEIYLHESRPE